MATTANTYTGNNSTVDYAFTFPYLKSTDIKVSLDEVVKTISDDYTLHNATTIRFNSAPAQDVAIKIYRDTGSAELTATFYPGSAIRSSDLNDNYTQNLYVTQEAENDAATALTNSRVLESGAYVSAITKANTAITTANSATSTANTASTNASNAVSTANTASTNATNAVNTANAADTIADNAKLATDRLVGTTSNNGSTWTVTGNNTNASTDPKGLGYAITTADTAKSTADSATTTANSAVSTANTASTNASNAVTTANAADAIADNAKLATDRLVATTSDGGNSWTVAGNNTNASTDPKGVGYAITTAEAANAAVAAAVLYTPTANVAAIPGSPSDGDYIEVQDSTGIESFSPLASMPSGFTGDPGLTVKLKYTSSGSTWNWQSYHTNDSEDRYVATYGKHNTTQITYTVKVATKTAAHRYHGSGASNGFTIGGIEAPFLTLIPGNKYRFDQADSSNSGHPIAFYRKADKTGQWTTDVTSNGTPGSAGAYTDITIGGTTPMGLSYQCTNHAYMGNGIVSQTGAGGAGATGGGSDEVLFENAQAVTTNYTITTNKSADSTGPITVNNSIAVTVPQNSIWVIH